MPDHANRKYSFLYFQLICLLPSRSSVAAYDADLEIGDATSSIKCIDEERKALIELKRGIKVHRCGLIASWGDNEESKDYCKWQGVQCNHLTGNVIMLDLHGVNTTSVNDPCLEGNINPSLLHLKHLSYLDLSNNDFQGQAIPSFFGSLTNLKHLNLSHTGFWGEVPHQLGNLSNLQSLHLGCTLQFHYCQYVKNLQWLSHLTSLRHIDFNHIDLSKATDWVQVIDNIPSLTYLRLNTCKLPPAIPTILSPQQNKPSRFLRVLDLGNNNLNSSIYQWLFNSSRFSNQFMEMIDFSQNQLDGPIPDELGHLYILKHLDFSLNKIECPIPDSIGNLKHLEYLALSQNKLPGRTLPKTFSDLASLKSLLLVNVSLMENLSSFVNRLSAQKLLTVLDLSGNKIWGSLPDLYDKFPHLKELNVDENELNGTFRKNIGKLSKLERFSMSSSSLKGTLSELHFGKLSRLQYLDLSNNSLLVFNFSAKWIPPFQLDTIRLRSSKLGPHFPKWIHTQNNFSHLNISVANISEDLPSVFWESLPTSKLNYLNMSHNNITGMIPTLSIHFDQLLSPEVDLSFNSFEGTIPSFLGNASSLSLNNNLFTDSIPLLCPSSRIALLDLDLSNNLLSGELPADCWVTMDQISFLNLESNKFSGNLPASLGTLKDLQSFRLCDNYFSGELPTSLEYCTSLVILDIGDNRFSGHIPTSIGGIVRKLVVLNLRRNEYHGSIPISLCKLSNLQILDLSGNKISGIIPKCIQNFTAMMNETNFLTHSSSYNSSERRLGYPYGAWVRWKRVQQKFGNMLGLVKSFDVSKNEIGGEIPMEISFLVGLVSLDLSRNNLTGSITMKIGQLRSLEMLDLSNNNLYGEIPISLTNLSFLGILDFSNNNLSGKIPIGTQLQSFDASAYMGNPELCGSPLPKKCKGDEPATKQENITNQEEKDNSNIFPGLYVSIALGFIIGFWGVSGALMLKKSWSDGSFLAG